MNIKHESERWIFGNDWGWFDGIKNTILGLAVVIATMSSLSGLPLLIKMAVILIMMMVLILWIVDEYRD